MQDLSQNCEMSRHKNISISKNADKTTNSKITKDKNEFAELVFHRKSERRRMARDIFLVFEEEPKTRRSVGQNKKNSRLNKPKFGHLKVGELNSSYNKTKNVLCTVKNDLNCFVNGKCKSAKLSGFNSNNTKVHNATSNVQRAKINPIFLWVKKEDTRIVEVRCEDYDKRNRIKITKTTSGWRATPCTDASSSKIVKFLPKPLSKMMREHVQPKRLENGKPHISLYHDKTLQSKQLNNNNKINNNISNNNNIDTRKEDFKCNTTLYGHNIEKYNNINGTNLSIDTYPNGSPDLQLCPKTGFFISKNIPLYEENSNQKNIFGVDHLNNHFNSINKDKLLKDLDAETENLKNLLDDADLLQHCTDNVNNCSDLIDSIVKDSCEHHLLVDDELVIKPSEIQNEIDRISTLRNIDGSTNNSPKCLSFNEAGEIEGVNEEIFETDNYIDTWVKQPKNHIQFTSLTADIGTPKPVEVTISDKSSLNEYQELPKDLSYRRREETLSPLSDCAVTSTSSVTKSTCENLKAVFDPTIKNVILEQVLKLTPLNSAKNQQTEPINLGKNQEAIAENFPKTNNIASTLNHNVHTEEPIKKRVCSSVKIGNSKDIKSNTDPDPLTQLRLLLRNTEWKVPDPILVPKDRLGAVLASPAREIPLLLTTRPELKLPEAFAFPDILQNPNILVISMAQLEEILRKEIQRQPLVDNINEKVSYENLNVGNQDRNKVDDTNQIDSNTKWFSLESNLPNVPTPTFAVMNQLFWLPFFGHLSQDLLNNIKNHSMSEINLKKNTLLSLINKQYDMETVKKMFDNHSNKAIHFSKNIMGQKSSFEIVKNSESKCTSPIEFAILNKIAEAKIHHLITSDQLQDHKRDYTKNILIDPNDGVNDMNSVNTLEHIRETLIESDSLSTILTSNDVLCSMHKPINDNITNTFGSKNSAVYKNTNKIRHVEENKPRLTCKSLSNLLNPNNVEHGVNPLQYLENKYNNQYQTFQSEPIFQRRDPPCVISPEASVVTNCRYLDGSSTNELVNHRKRSFNGLETDTEEINFNGVNTLADSNPDLWTPLFRSNNSHGYSSPWQWTTVTASGE